MPNFHWTPFWEDQIREFAKTKTSGEIAAILGVKTVALWPKAQEMGITFVSPKNAMTPEDTVWISAATVQASFARVPLREVLGYNPTRKASLARWNAFKAVLDSDDRYSVAGLSRISGFDRTSILYGLTRLSGIAAKDAGRCRALGRIPSLKRAREILAAE